MSHEFDVRLAKDVTDSDEISPILVIRGQVEGALPNGSFVEKCDSNESDSYLDGTVGIVISSLIGEDGGIGYQVVFACERPLPTFVSAERVRGIPPPQGLTRR